MEREREIYIGDMNKQKEMTFPANKIKVHILETLHS